MIYINRYYVCIYICIHMCVLYTVGIVCIVCILYTKWKVASQAMADPAVRTLYSKYVNAYTIHEEIRWEIFRKTHPRISEKQVMFIMVYESFWPWIRVNHVKSPFLRQDPPVDHVASWDMPLFWEGEAWLRVPTFQLRYQIIHRNVGWSQLFEPLWLRGKILAHGAHVQVEP